MIYLNLNAGPQDAEHAKKALEVAHGCLNGRVDIGPRQIEFVDLRTGILHSIDKRRARLELSLGRPGKPASGERLQALRCLALSKPAGRSESRLLIGTWHRLARFPVVDRLAACSDELAKIRR